MRKKRKKERRVEMRNCLGDCGRQVSDPELGYCPACLDEVRVRIEAERYLRQHPDPNNPAPRKIDRLPHGRRCSEEYEPPRHRLAVDGRVWHGARLGS